jgi:DnaJ-domain-containing protein 1
MITSQDKELVARLIKNYASNTSTDRMLASIADNTGMLGACQLLLRKNNEDDREVLSWVDEQCYQRKVDLRNFLYEVQQVVSIFQPDQENDEYYLALGLEIGAGEKEIKEAYRELCLRYHPDTTTLSDDEAATAFIEVNEAYRVLRNNVEKGRKHVIRPTPSPHWSQENKTNTVSASKKRRNIFWFSSLTFLMIVSSILAARSYQKKAMITGLQLHQAAFIPPNSDSELEVKKTPEKNEPALALTNVGTEIAVNVEPAKISDKKLLKAKVVTIVEKVSEVPLASVVEAVETIPEEVSAEEIVVKEEKRDEKNSESAHSVSAGKSLDKPEVVIVVKDSKKSKKIFEQRSLLEVSVPAAAFALPIDVAVPEPTPEEVHVVKQSQIEQFLKNYVAAYEKKDLQTFSSFFDENATENGKAINSVFPTYIELFAAAGEIIFDISILKWSENQENVEMDGRFAIRIHYKDGKKVKGTGTISFLLKDLQPEFLIKEMTYQFDKI